MWLTWFAIGLGAAAVFGGVLWRYRRPEVDDTEWRRALARTEALAEAHPDQAWQAAVLPLLGELADPAWRPRFARARLAARGLRGAEAFERALAERQSSDAALPLIEAIQLWRLGAGAGRIDEPAARTQVTILRRALQARYSGFEPLAEDLLRDLARRLPADHPQLQTTAAAIARLRADRWPALDFRHPP